MIKTAQDAYLAGRQAGMEKVSNPASSTTPDYLAAQPLILANNLLGLGTGGTIAGAGLGAYVGDRDLRSVGISALGALGGGQVGANLGFGLLQALNSAGVKNPLGLVTAFNFPTLAGQLGGGYLAGRYTKRK